VLVEIVAIVLLSACTYSGWRTGLFRSLMAVVGLAAGTAVGTAFGLSFGGWLHRTQGMAEWLSVLVGFGLLFIATLAAFMVVGSLGRGLLRAMLLRWVDSAAGAAVGLITGLLATALVVTFTASVPSLRGKMEPSTALGRAVVNLVPGLFPDAPGYFYRLWESTISGTPGDWVPPFENPFKGEGTVGAVGESLREKLDAAGEVMKAAQEAKKGLYEELQRE
jgi:uncharacterized membrane protein required for colicin V production